MLFLALELLGSSAAMKPPSVVAFLLTLSGTAPAQDAGPRFTQFEFARERIGHKVIVDATLVNTASQDLTDVRITVSYFVGDRELRKSRPVQVARIAAQESASFKI